MSLAGATIVVTRPQGRGESLCQRIEAAGGEAVFFPVIRIAAVPSPELPTGSPDWLIFASPAAVEHGPALLRSRLADETRIAAIGEGTAALLASAGLQADAVPRRQESEGLLEMDAFQQLDGRRVWIVRGRGGRELLGDTLRARGAETAFIEVYERQLPAGGSQPLLDAWQNDRCDAIVVSSRAGLENLHTVLDEAGRARLRETQLVMPTARMLKLALEFAIRPVPVIADGASDDAFMAALSRWWREKRREPNEHR